MSFDVKKFNSGHEVEKGKDSKKIPANSKETVKFSEFSILQYFFSSILVYYVRLSEYINHKKDLQYVKL